MNDNPYRRAHAYQEWEWQRSLPISLTPVYDVREMSSGLSHLRVSLPRILQEWLHDQFGWVAPSYFAVSPVSGEMKKTMITPPHLRLCDKVSKEVWSVVRLCRKQSEKMIIHLLWMDEFLRASTRVMRWQCHLTGAMVWTVSGLYTLMYLPSRQLVWMWSHSSSSSSSEYSSSSKPSSSSEHSSSLSSIFPHDNEEGNVIIACTPRTKTGKFFSTTFRAEYLEGNEQVHALIQSSNETRLEMTARRTGFTRTTFQSRYSSYEETLIPLNQSDRIECFVKNGVTVFTFYSASFHFRRSWASTMMFDGTERDHRFDWERECDLSTGLIRRECIRRDGEVVYLSSSSSSHPLVSQTWSPRPRSGEMTGWKLARLENGEEAIVTLHIPANARVVMPMDDLFPTGHLKMRCDRALVVAIEPVEDNEEKNEERNEERIAFSCVYSFSSSETPLEYRVGTWVVPDSFDDCPSKACAPGIHFFPDRRSVFRTYSPTGSKNLKGLEKIKTD